MKLIKKLLNCIIITITLCFIFSITIEEYREIGIEKKEIINNEEKSDINLFTQNNKLFNSLNNLEQLRNIKVIEKEEIISEFKGYDVIAKLEIPKIALETYVLKNFSNESLNVSVTKFWGPNPNEIGNLCIAGHNFKNKNMFHNLKKLEKGDKFFISDNYIGKLEYEIFDILKVVPEDVSCLSQETNGNKEVTLITCTNDSKKRIIVKAKEIKYE